jgi:hypothetical protein
MIRQKTVTADLVQTLETKVDRAGAEKLPRYRDLLADAVAARPEAAVFQELAQTILHLPLDQATPLLEQGYALAPTAELRERIGKTIQKIRSGGGSPSRLERELGRPKSTHVVADAEFPFELLGTPNDE